MGNDSAKPCIRLRGVRQNNLKGFDLDLPLGRFVVVTGLSGSGKSSLAFETLFAEGQRRYIETFSPYARQFLDRMDKPKVDHIEGIPPAIAIEQRNSVKSTRSTVGTMTEIGDYTKLFWPRLAQLYCKKCGKPVQKESPNRVWEVVSREFKGEEVLVTFKLELSEKLSLKESLALVAKQGYQRLLVESNAIRFDEALPRLENAKTSHIVVVQDRLLLSETVRARFVEACEQACHFGQGKMSVHVLAKGGSIRETRHFSNKFHCATCDLEYREPTAALFSFNHPIGACPVCRGFGRVITIDYDAAIPDRSKTLAGGVVKPWQTGTGVECQQDMERFAKIRKVPLNVPFQDLPKKWQNWVVEGDPDYGKDKDHEWPQAWYGVKGYFKWLESKSYKMHVRVMLSRYRVYKLCTHCRGTRFQPEALFYRLGASGKELTISEFYSLSLAEALGFVDSLLSARPSARVADPITLALKEVHSRLNYLVEVGLGYLTLDRVTRSLSGGETERVNLTSCLGSRLVNTLFVLDEPSVGLHARDTGRLIRILEHLRDAGNTVVVVEHEASVMRAADQILDIGPGHGESGGQIVFQGPYKEILRNSESLTGQYLSGKKRMEPPQRRPVSLGKSDTIILSHARIHNLKDLTVQIPLKRLVCVTGVSGSGKTTLMREVLLPALEAKFKQSPQTRPNRDVDEDNESENEDFEQTDAPREAEVAGWERLSQVVLVDQSPLGKTPRSNPAVYIGSFDEIRAFFAQTEGAKQRGLNASAFSFNSGQGQCERCHGAGFEKIEMQFLSDVFIRCPDCHGRRYRDHILEVTVTEPHTDTNCFDQEPRRASDSLAPRPSGERGTQKKPRNWSIADLLESTVDDVIDFLSNFPESRYAQRASESLALLQEVGLGYLRLGQPINTLSGGESQRLKLVSHLANVKMADQKQKPILFMFDEPTTGLHFDDTRVLLKVFQRLVDAGHSVLVIEHNLDVIRSADWVIDLGPEGGDQGGQIVVQGSPEKVAACAGSFTGKALADG